MARPKLKEQQKKQRVGVSLSPDILAIAGASGNISEWLSEAAEERVKREGRRKK